MHTYEVSAMLDKETLTSQGEFGCKPRLEDDAFFECLRRAKDCVEEEHVVECFEKVLELKK